MLDNYCKAPQKCQYVKVGAVCEMNGGQQSVRSQVAATLEKDTFLPSLLWISDV